VGSAAAPLRAAALSLVPSRAELSPRLPLPPLAPLAALAALLEVLVRAEDDAFGDVAGLGAVLPGVAPLVPVGLVLPLLPVPPVSPAVPAPVELAVRDG
jgi:hypothetical protein